MHTKTYPAPGWAGSLRDLVKGICQETTDDIKQMSCLTINFNLIYFMSR